MLLIDFTFLCHSFRSTTKTPAENDDPIASCVAILRSCRNYDKPAFLDTIVSAFYTTTDALEETQTTQPTATTATDGNIFNRKTKRQMRKNAFFQVLERLISEFPPVFREKILQKTKENTITAKEFVDFEEFQRFVQICLLSEGKKCLAFSIENALGTYGNDVTVR